MKNQLPKNIKQQVLEYLHLEYGEASVNGKLHLDDLVYEGLILIDGVNTHCWGFPSMKDDVWATVVVGAEEELHFSTARKLVDTENFKYIFVEVDGPDYQKTKFNFIYDQDSDSSSVDDELVRVFDGTSICISSEIFFTPSPPQVSIVVSYGEREFRAQGSVGLHVSFPLNNDEVVNMVVGNLDSDWD